MDEVILPLIVLFAFGDFDIRGNIDELINQVNQDIHVVEEFHLG